MKHRTSGSIMNAATRALREGHAPEEIGSTARHMAAFMIRLAWELEGQPGGDAPELREIRSKHPRSAGEIPDSPEHPAE